MDIVKTLKDARELAKENGYGECVVTVSYGQVNTMKVEYRWRDADEDRA